MNPNIELRIYVTFVVIRAAITIKLMVGVHLLPLTIIIFIYVDDMPQIISSCLPTWALNHMSKCFDMSMGNNLCLCIMSCRHTCMILYMSILTQLI
jgi:hypothetical protein